MADGLFVCLMVGSFLAAIYYDHTGHLHDAVLAGLAMALTVLTKPVGLVPSALLLLVLFRRMRLPRLVPMATLLACMTAPLALWATRNEIACDSFTPLSAEGAVNLWSGTYEPTSPLALSYWSYPEGELIRILGGHYWIGEPGNARLLRAAKQRIAEDPGAFVLRGVSRAIRVGFLDIEGGRSVLLSWSPFAYRTVQVGMVGIWALFVVGVRRAGPLRPFLLITPVAVFTVSMVYWCPARGFMAFHLLLLMGAASGALHCRQSGKGRRSPPRRSTTGADTNPTAHRAGWGPVPPIRLSPQGPRRLGPNAEPSGAGQSGRSCRSLPSPIRGVPRKRDILARAVDLSMGSLSDPSLIGEREARCDQDWCDRLW
jgi:hypothetical protein